MLLRERVLSTGYRVESREPFVLCTLYLILCTFLLSSCNIINPPEQIPVYLQVNNFTLQTNPSSQGSSSSKFTDVWVTVDGVAQGAYELQAGGASASPKFPLLFSGPHTLHLAGGIMLNGIAATRAPYSVLNSFDTTINFIAGNSISINPVVTYSAAAHFAQMEDFDHNGIYSYPFKPFKKSDTTYATLIDTSGSDSFEGKYGAVFLDDIHPLFQYESADTFYIAGGKTSYVELNYKCNNEFTVGTIATTPFGKSVTAILSIRPADTWKKIYVNLTPTVNGTYASDWKIYLYALKSDSQATAYLYFDNIKVLY